MATSLKNNLKLLMEKITEITNNKNIGFGELTFDTLAYDSICLRINSQPSVVDRLNSKNNSSTITVVSVYLQYDDYLKVYSDASTIFNYFRDNKSLNDMKIIKTTFPFTQGIVQQKKLFLVELYVYNL